MAYNNQWLVPNRILVVTYSGKVTIDEVLGCFEASREIVRKCEGTVHAITDLDDITKYPPNLNTYHRILGFRPAENLGVTIIIAHDPFLRMVVGTFMRMLNTPFHVASSLDDAIDYLYDSDETLPPLRIRDGTDISV